MPPYKKQHYLPASYLKYFSDDQTKCTRQSGVWRFDAKDLRRVPVESQCFKDYFYSKEKPSEVESAFKKREDAYCRFVDQIRLGGEPGRREFGDFFLCMFDLYLRNAVHRNNTGSEGIKAYEHRLNLFFSNLLLCKEPAHCTIQAVKEHITTHWRMEIIPAPPDYEFLTSDHPSMFLTCTSATPNVGKALQLIVLPIDPKHVAFAFDRRFLWLEKRVATPKDVETLNLTQVQKCLDCIYLSRSMDDEERQATESAFTKKSPNRCQIDEKGWTFHTSYIPPENHFSFMRLKPPLL